jgi:Icc-related predicted phosphoesterase
MGIFDKIENAVHVGSRSLRDRVLHSLPNLKLHVFGHIHENGGRKRSIMKGDVKITFVNASHVDENYRPAYNVVRIEL